MKQSKSVAFPSVSSVFSDTTSLLGTDTAVRTRGKERRRRGKLREAREIPTETPPHWAGLCFDTLTAHRSPLCAQRLEQSLAHGTVQ